MKKTVYPKVKWKSLTPARLRALAGDVFDAAHDMEIDRDHMLEEQGADVVGEHEALGRYLVRKAEQRERAAVKVTRAPEEPCCEAARQCAELRYDSPDDALDAGDFSNQWTIIVDQQRDSPCGVDLIRGAINYCPFCGTSLK